jgi:hypothetical protein
MRHAERIRQMDRPFDYSIKDGQMDRPFDDPDRNMRARTDHPNNYPEYLQRKRRMRHAERIRQMDRPFDDSIKDGQMDRTDGQAFCETLWIRQMDRHIDDPFDDPIRTRSVGPEWLAEGRGDVWQTKETKGQTFCTLTRIPRG